MKRNELFEKCVANCDPATIKEVSDSVDLENEVDAYIENERYFPDDERPLVLEIARHFAQWGADHLRDSTKMVDKSLEEAADKHIRKVVDAAGHPGWDWTTQDIADAFIAGASWQKEQMLKDAVEGEAEELYNDGESQCVVSVGTYFKPGDEVYVIPKEEKK